MRRLKLMADYGCHPLWGTVDPEIGDLDPASLPLSAALVADLAAWAEGFEATLDPRRGSRPNSGRISRSSRCSEPSSPQHCSWIAAGRMPI